MAISNAGTAPSFEAKNNLVQPEQNLTKPKSTTGAEQGVEQAKTIANGFSTIFALLQQEQSKTDEKNHQGKDKKEDQFIKALQGSLLGSLGAQAGEGKSMEEQLKSLTSDESIEKLKTAFLVSLQQSLFSAKNKGQDGTDKAGDGKSEGEQDAKDASVMKKLETFSFGKNGLEINDGFDSVNILNHVPVVSEIYKNVTGHDVSAISKLAGGYIYGGPTGLVFSAIELTSQSLFDTSIGSALANFNYGQLFGNEQTKATTETSKAATSLSSTVSLPTGSVSPTPNTQQPDAIIEWPNSRVKGSGVTAK